MGAMPLPEAAIIGTGSTNSGFGPDHDQHSNLRRRRPEHVALALGARASLTTSQINIGHWNVMAYDIAGSKASAAWQAKMPYHLWLGL